LRAIQDNRNVVSRELEHAMPWYWLIGGCLAISLVLGLSSSTSVLAASPIRNFAIVQDDGSLRVQGQTIRLFGTHIPRTGRRCESRLRPIKCGSRAALALELIIRGFVTCHPQGRYRDRSISAICYVEHGSIVDPPLDLGAWLIEKGLAVASPEAPFEYVTLERIAQAQNRGIWGFQFD
jgi:endonuclease YncB( thermonuclease family)